MFRSELSYIIFTCVGAQAKQTESASRALTLPSIATVVVVKAIKWRSTTKKTVTSYKSIGSLVSMESTQLSYVLQLFSLSVFSFLLQDVD